MTTTTFAAARPFLLASTCVTSWRREVGPSPSSWKIIGRPVQAVSEILNGKKEITTETAWELSDVSHHPELRSTWRCCHRTPRAAHEGALDRQAQSRCSPCSASEPRTAGQGPR